MLVYYSTLGTCKIFLIFKPEKNKRKKEKKMAKEVKADKNTHVILYTAKCQHKYGPKIILENIENIAIFWLQNQSLST